MDHLESVTQKMHSTLEHLKSSLQVIRSGRASVHLLDKILVDSYGEKLPLNQVATVSVADARQIVIQPWDKSLLGAIDKSIRNSDLSIMPVTEGAVLRLNIPPLTQERRLALVKQVKQIGEQSKVSVRNIRREFIDEVKKLEKKGELSLDLSKKQQLDAQTVTDKFTKEIENLIKAKETEILDT